MALALYYPFSYSEPFGAHELYINIIFSGYVDIRLFLLQQLGAVRRWQGKIVDLFFPSFLVPSTYYMYFVLPARSPAGLDMIEKNNGFIFFLFLGT